MTDNNGSPTDAELVAYIDGELDFADPATLDVQLDTDQALRARLEYLRRGGRDFAPAFTVLLEVAPTRRLSKILAEAVAQVLHAPELTPSAAGHGWNCSLQSRHHSGSFPASAEPPFELVDGFGQPGETELPNWRAAAVEYLQLCTTDTVAPNPDDAATRAIELRAAGAKLDLDLDPAAVALANFTLTRAQTVNLCGMPFVQISYLSLRGELVTLFIIRNGKPDTDPEFEERLGKSIVSWQKGGRGYLIIGMTPRAQLFALATTLKTHLSTASA